MVIVSVCDRKDTDPYSGIRPGQVTGHGPVVGSAPDSEGGGTCSCVSCGSDQTQSWDYVGSRWIKKGR